MNIDSSLLTKLEAYPEVTLHLNNAPQGFAHTLHCRLILESATAVVVVILWQNAHYKLMQFLPHTVIAIEYDTSLLGEFI